MLWMHAISVQCSTWLIVENEWNYWVGCTLWLIFSVCILVCSTCLQGGAVSIDHSGSSGTFTNCNFSSNSAPVSLEEGHFDGYEMSECMTLRLCHPYIDMNWIILSSSFPLVSFSDVCLCLMIGDFALTTSSNIVLVLYLAYLQMQGQVSHSGSHHHRVRVIPPINQPSTPKLLHFAILHEMLLPILRHMTLPRYLSLSLMGRWGGQGEIVHHINHWHLYVMYVGWHSMHLHFLASESCDAMYICMHAMSLQM